MDRTPFLATALAVTALLALPSAGAYADPSADAQPTSDAAGSVAGDAQSSDGSSSGQAEGGSGPSGATPTAAPDGDPSVQQDPASLDAGSPQAGSADQGGSSTGGSSTGDSSAGGSAPEGSGSSSGGSSPGGSSSGGSSPSGSAPQGAGSAAPSSTATVAAPATVAGEPQSSAAPPPAGGAGVQLVQPTEGPLLTAPESKTISSTPLAPADRSKAVAPGGAAAPATGAPAAGNLERVLPTLERDLRTVQSQIDDLRRRVDGGAAPPASLVTRLRAKLERIAPVLAALQVQLSATGRLSPRLRDLLRRVHVRLTGARVSAAGLIAALRRSGASGPELRLLLHELMGLRALRAALAANPSVEPAPVRPVLGATLGYAPGDVRPEPAVAAQPAAASPPAQQAADRRAAAAPDGGSGPSEPEPLVSAPGSATASAGGAFSVAGPALLAALLIALALSGLRGRVQLAPDRAYRVAFLTPLGRPG